MKIVGIDTANKKLPLDRHFESLSDWAEQLDTEVAEDHVLIIHRQRPIDSYLAEVRRVDAASESVGGILFLKGESYAGIGKQKAEEWSRRPSELSVHVLSYSVPNVEEGSACSMDVVQRFKKFGAAMSDRERGAEIPWHLLEPPPWPEDVVAAYLALVAKDESCDVTGYVNDEIWARAQEQVGELVTAYEGGGAADEAIELTDAAKRASALPALRRILERVAEKQSS